MKHDIINSGVWYVGIMNRSHSTLATTSWGKTTTSEGYDRDSPQHDHRNSLESGVTSTGNEIL